MSMSPACPLMSGIDRAVSGADRVCSFVSFSSSSAPFLFFISGLYFPSAEPSSFCVLSGCRTTLAFVVGGVCPRDDILSLYFVSAHRSMMSLSHTTIGGDLLCWFFPRCSVVRFTGRYTIDGNLPYRVSSCDGNFRFRPQFYRRRSALPALSLFTGGRHFRLLVLCCLVLVLTSFVV